MRFSTLPRYLMWNCNGDDGDGAGGDSGSGGFSDIGEAEGAFGFDSAAEAAGFAGGAGFGAGDQSGAMARDEAAAIGAFEMESQTSFAQDVAGFFGFNDFSPAAIHGASLSNPSAFSAGKKAGLSFEALGTISALASLPARIGIGLIEQTVESLADPSFSAGVQSVEADTTGAAIGTATGFAFGPDIGRAVEVGLGLANVGQQAADAGFTSESESDTSTTDLGNEGAGREALRERSASSRQTSDLDTQLGAIVTTRETEFTQQTSTSTERVNRGRGSLRVRRTT